MPVTNLRSCRNLGITFQVDDLQGDFILVKLPHFCVNFLLFYYFFMADDMYVPCLSSAPDKVTERAGK